MEKLGINPFQLVIQLVNFVILVALLTKFLYRPLLKLLNDRQKKIEEGIELTKKLNEEKEKLGVLREKEIDKGREEAAKIIQESKDRAKLQAQKILKEAEVAASAEIEKRRKELEAEKMKLQDELRRETVEVASTLAEKILTEFLNDEKNQRKIIEKQIEALREKT